MRKKKSLIKILLVIVFYNISCADKSSSKFDVDFNNKSVIKSLVKTEMIFFEQRKDTIKLKVKDSGLKSIIGKEMGASSSSLILYEEFLKYENQSNTNTIFSIIYLNENTKYHYSLLDLSDVLLGEKKIENYFKIIENKKAQNKHNNSNLCQFGGFKIDEFNREIS